MEVNRCPCLISCGVFKTEIEKLLAEGDFNLEPHFLSMDLHFDYDLLEKELGATIEKYRQKRPAGIIVAYGDVCLGFNNEMKKLIDRYNVIKIDALNCIDCMLGGSGKLLAIDPEHKYLFLNPAFIKFTEKIMPETKEEARKMFGMLEGIILIDAMGDLDEYRNEIEEICDKTGLPILARKNVGVEGIKHVLQDVVERSKSHRYF